MHDHNTLRHHYTTHSRKLARSKFWRHAAEWLITWALIIVLILCLA